jgi:hypothetical protein
MMQTKKQSTIMKFSAFAALFLIVNPTNANCMWPCQGLKGRSNTGDGLLVEDGNRSQMLVDKITNYYPHLQPKKADGLSLNCGKSQKAVETEVTCGGTYSCDIWLEQKQDCTGKTGAAAMTRGHLRAMGCL